MSDEMIDLAAGDTRLRQRLEAYSDGRLTPDLAATSRMRARVLAHAHRRSDLARADAALRIVPEAASRIARERRVRQTRRAAFALVSAAILAGAMVGGAAASSGPGEALYDARLWVESVTLPSDPSARAVAELSRLAERLREAETAARTGDGPAAAAALAAYERIMSEASNAVLAAHDPVAAAALETGLGRNVDVLQALIARVPQRATEVISAAVARAITRSAGAIDTMGAVHRPAPIRGPSGHDATGNGQSGGGGSNAGVGAGGAGSNTTGQTATPKPTKTAPNQPDATAKPTATERPEPSAKPTPKPTPDVTAPPRPVSAPPGGPPEDPQD